METPEIEEIAQETINNYPPLLSRFLSVMTDGLVIIALMIIFTKISEAIPGFPDDYKLYFIIALFLYEPLCITFGCTIGNLLMKIRVRRANDPSRKINFLQALLRYIVKGLLGWLSFLTIGMNKQRQAIHDLAANSVVIKAENA